MSCSSPYDIDKKQEFYNIVIEKFKKCAISKHPQTRCDVVHIKQHIDAAHELLYDINNGLLLDSGIHKIFDQHYLSIHPDTNCVEINKEYLDYDRYMLSYDGVTVRDIKKSRVYLVDHYENSNKQYL